MRRGTKIGLIAALILGIAGVALTVGGLVAGAGSIIAGLSAGDLSWVNELVEFGENHDVLDHGVTEGEVEKQETVYAADESISEITVECNVGDIDIHAISDYAESVPVDGIVVTTVVNRDYYTVEQSVESGMLSITIHNTDDKHMDIVDSPEMDIYLPEGYELNLLMLTSDVGEISIDTDLTCDTLELQTSTGNIELKGEMVVRGDTNVRTDVGEINIANLDGNGEVTLQSDVGSINFMGDAQTALNITTETGEVTAELFRDEDAYNQKLTVDLGTVKINGHQVADMGDTYEKEYPGANTVLAITSDIGEVKVSFGAASANRVEQSHEASETQDALHEHLDESKEEL